MGILARYKLDAVEFDVRVWREVFPHHGFHVSACIADGVNCPLRGRDFGQCQDAVQQTAVAFGCHAIGGVNRVAVNRAKQRNAQLMIHQSVSGVMKRNIRRMKASNPSLNADDRR